MVFVLSDSQMETLKDFISDHDLEGELMSYVNETDKISFRAWLGWEEDLEDDEKEEEE